MTSKVHPEYDTVQDPNGTGTDPPPAYMPYQAPQGPQMSMMGGAQSINMMGMNLNVSVGATEAQWVSPGVGGAMALLDGVDEVMMEQQLDILNATMGCGPKKFSVETKQGGRLFILDEDPTEVSSVMNFRAFNVRAKDCNGEIVFSVSRDKRICSYCCFCFACCNGCRANAVVMEKDNIIGQLRQSCSATYPVYELLDDNDSQLMKVEGESACCTPAGTFMLEKCDDGEKGRILKVGGAMMMSFTSRYAIRFPKTADARQKANCIAFAVLFNFRFHSKNPGGGGRRRRRR